MNLTVKPKAPGFIGIGMERAGTSWLFTQLASHPDIWVPPLKEIHYFDVIDPQAKFLDHRYSYHLKSRALTHLRSGENFQNLGILIYQRSGPARLSEKIRNGYGTNTTSTKRR